MPRESVPDIPRPPRWSLGWKRTPRPNAAPTAPQFSARLKLDIFAGTKIAVAHHSRRWCLRQEPMRDRGVHRDADRHAILVQDHAVGVAWGDMILTVVAVGHDAEEHHAAGDPL